MLDGAANICLMVQQACVQLHVHLPIVPEYGNETKIYEERRVRRERGGGGGVG